MTYHAKEFNSLNEQFNNAAKQILDGVDLSSNALEILLDSYNTVITYAEIDYEKKKKRTKEHIESTIEVNRITVQRCFEKLGLPVILPAKLLSTIHYIIKEQNRSKTLTNQSTQTEQHLSIEIETQTEQLSINENFSQTDLNKSIENFSQTETNIYKNHLTQTERIKLINMPTQTDKETKPTTTVEKAQTIDDLMKYTQSILNYKFTGDPLDLNGFISDAELLYSLARNEETQEFCFTYIKNRVRGRAEEFIPDDCKSFEALKKALKDKIKPQSSVIIEGKMIALQVNKNDYTKFASDVEKLAEALRRSLVVEGITKAKAESMTIQKTIDLCRSNAKNSVVKSVLESNRFESSAEVVAAFITQSDKARREAKDAQASNPNKSNTGNYTQRHRNFNRNRNGNNDKRSDNRSDNRYGNRGNRNRNQQNQQRNRGRNNNSRSNQNEQTIRLIAGSQPDTPVEQPQPEEQFFRVTN